MAKFAHDCMMKLDQIVERLAPTLGKGTDELALRTGMHSGEVTAGVLRGEKGRFQLFGDTVNTASRMESTGTPRRIQVSQSTADVLILEGKESWLVPRREKVYAKGKGDMQTYFLELKEKSDKPPSSVRSSERTQRTGSDGMGNP
jgi:class 3 adenylate cyclase